MITHILLTSFWESCISSFCAYIFAECYYNDYNNKVKQKNSSSSWRHYVYDDQLTSFRLCLLMIVRTFHNLLLEGVSIKGSSTCIYADRLSSIILLPSWKMAHALQMGWLKLLKYYRWIYHNSAIGIIIEVFYNFTQ